MTRCQLGRRAFQRRGKARVHGVVLTDLRCLRLQTILVLESTWVTVNGAKTLYWAIRVLLRACTIVDEDFPSLFFNDHFIERS
jgi:hypothetical protein